MRLLSLNCSAFFLLLLLTSFSAKATGPEGAPTVAPVPQNGLQFFYKLRADYKESHGGQLPQGTLYCHLRVDEKGDHLMKTINTMPSKEFVMFVQKQFNDLKFLPALDADNRPMVSTVSFSINFDGNPMREEGLIKNIHFAFQPDMKGWQAEKRAYYDAYIAAKKEKLASGSIPSTAKEEAPDQMPAPKNLEKMRKNIAYPSGLSRDEKASVANSLRFRVLIAPNGDFVAYEPLHKEVKGAQALLAENISHGLSQLKCTPAQKDGRNVYAWLVLPFVIDPAN